MTLVPATSAQRFTGGSLTAPLTVVSDAVPAALTVAPTDDVAGNSLRIVHIVAPAGYLNDNTGVMLDCVDEDGVTSAQLAEGGQLLLRTSSIAQASLRVANQAVSATFQINPTAIAQTGSTGTNFGVNGAGDVTAQDVTARRLLTNPPAAVTSALVLGTAYQNTLGYDVLLCVYLSVTANTSGVVALGVGPTNTPGQNTIITGLTSTGLWTIPIYLPYLYYALLSVSGTVTAVIDGQIAMGV